MLKSLCFLDKAAPCCFRFWGPSPSIFFGVHPSTRGNIGPMRPAHPRRFEKNIINAHCVVQNRRARARLSREPNARVVVARVFARNQIFALKGENRALKEEEKKIVNETTLARCELYAHLCCSSTRSEHSSRLTRRIATRMPFLF